MFPFLFLEKSHNCYALVSEMVFILLQPHLVSDLRPSAHYHESDDLAEYESPPHGIRGYRAGGPEHEYQQDVPGESAPHGVVRHTHGL